MSNLTRSLIDRIVDVAKEEPHLLHLEAWDALGYVIVVLADERDSYRQQRDWAQEANDLNGDKLAALEREHKELLALLRDTDTACDGSDDGDDDPPCWGCRATAALDKYKMVS